MADQSSKPLQFFVRLLDGKSITLNFSSPLAYGEQIKQRIFEQTKIPTHLQRLICGGYQISDESVVSQSDSTVNLVLSLRGGMASSNGTNKYPLRMYEEGKAPLQWKSTNHNCNLANFGMVKNGLGLDVWDYLKNSAVGVIIKLYERNMIWCSATVHYFLTRQLSITRSHEIWTLISGRPIRLSLHEFSEITGLNCDPSNIEDKCDVNHKDFWKYMEVPIGAGPSLDELVLVLKRCQTWSFEQKRMVGWLFILSIGIFGISRSSRLPLRYAKMVLNPELFEKYPWGRVAFNSLVESIKIICFEAKKAYTVRGCVHALQVWAYESVPVLGELYGRRLEGMEVPLLSWGGSRDRVNLDDMLAEEKSIHDKVRVRHLIVKPEEEIYRPWSIEDETDTELDNMIRDILHDHLDESFWDSVGAKANKQKQKRRLHEVQMSRKKRKNDVNVSCAPTETFKDARENSGNRERELSFHGLDGLVQKVELMTEKIAEMVSNIANKAATCLEAAIDARLDERFVPMVNKLAMLEKDMEQLKQRTQACQPKEVSNSNEDDEAVSKTPILDASMSRTRTEFEQQKQCMHGLEGRLADAELQLREGELLRKKLHNTILELKGNICVFCRVRPLLPDDGDGGHQVASVIAYPTSTESRGRGIDVVESGKKHQFTFDKVFDHRASQEEVFVEISELVQSAMDGYKVCIFAYGQTGSGKTYTMMGRPEAPEQKGLIPRSMEQIFKTSESLSTKGWKCNMRVSMLEVYNESIRDLLGIESVRTDFRSPGKQYTIRHNDNGNTVVNDLTIVDVCTIEQISSLLQKAAKSRSVGKTHMNEQSSRSHFVLTLQIFGVKSTEEQFQGVLNLIDLAGSQRLLKSGVAAETLKETVAINQSLSALGDVINALAKKKDHVPFRNSTLTYLLQPCLGGDSKTLMFVNISSDPSSTGESLCSLRFAAKVNECEI